MNEVKAKHVPFKRYDKWKLFGAAVMVLAAINQIYLSLKLIEIGTINLSWILGVILLIMAGLAVCSYFFAKNSHYDRVILWIGFGMVLPYGVTELVLSLFEADWTQLIYWGVLLLIFLASMIKLIWFWNYDELQAED